MNFKIMCLFLAEIQYKVLFKRYLPEYYGMYHVNSDSNLYILIYNLANLQGKSLGNNNSLRNLTLNNKIPDENFISLILFLAYIKYKMSCKRYLFDKYDNEQFSSRKEFLISLLIFILC